MKDIWTYEAKCRKCGNVNDFFCGYKESISQEAFTRIVTEQMSNPFLHRCTHCPTVEGKIIKTVFDVISANL